MVGRSIGTLLLVVMVVSATSPPKAGKKRKRTTETSASIAAFVNAHKLRTAEEWHALDPRTLQLIANQENIAITSHQSLAVTLYDHFQQQPTVILDAPPANVPPLAGSVTSEVVSAPPAQHQLSQSTVSCSLPTSTRVATSTLGSAFPGSPRDKKGKPQRQWCRPRQLLVQLPTWHLMIWVGSLMAFTFWVHLRRWPRPWMFNSYYFNTTRLNISRCKTSNVSWQ